MSNCTPQSRGPVKFAENHKVEKISMTTLVEDSQPKGAFTYDVRFLGRHRIKGQRFERFFEQFLAKSFPKIFQFFCNENKEF